MSLASQPVGYKDGNDYYAALEYSFTGALAFRGWDYPANYNLIYNSEGQALSFDGDKSKGFYVFSTPDINASWFAVNRNKERYNFNMDFCATYREEIECTDCKNNINPLWPGIRMKEESGGWYKFELTGIATPGKALIMFADGHKYEQNMNRFPGDSQVGVPLFDYPSKEGWFLYNSVETDRITNQFSPTKPEPIKYVCRIYWPQNLCEQTHLWVEAGDVITDWNNSKYSGKYKNYYYYDFDISAYSNNLLNVIFHNGNTSIASSSLYFSTFQMNQEVGRRCAYYDGSGFKSGVPN